MNCPVCKNTPLVMTDRSGVEIDYCPSCRGVWLDRGELDKIIERSNAYMHDSQHSDRNHAPHDYDKKYYGKKKKGFLGDFFDFD